MSNLQTSQGEQPAPVAPPSGHEAPIGFFAVGLVVNLALLTAYGIWAYRQWKKPRERDKT